ncbi:hypothetical protein KY289_007715 [Solanum tuberosum]|nr:hypothetical protein KY289_007715 [Solanum tuberosum]KAH0714539.1 hypothetical protein KY284_007444 [Solanum tuberosum]
MASWSDLPKEIVEKISESLDSHIDITRFRAVCNSWRSAISPNFKISKSLFPIKLPLPKITMTEDFHKESEFYLIESTVYLLQLPHPPHTPWLIKVVKTVDGKLRILNLLTNTVFKGFPDKKLNSLDFRLSQVFKSYHVQWILKPYARECELQSGDEKWTALKDRSAKIVDIIVYKGDFYAVDTYGETIMYDPSSFNETNVSSNVKGLSSSIFNGWGSKKRLVESGGELFLVDMFLDTDVKTELHGSQPSWKSPKEIKIYRLDEEQHEWIAVHTLGDRIFFAGDDCCFSVSSSDFGDQCRGNCIYYVNGGIVVNILGNDLSEEVKLRYKGLHGQHTDIFWPPSSWLYTGDRAALQTLFTNFTPQNLPFLSGDEP